MPVELRQLRYFRHLAEELNFSRAAKKANISQSSMTEQIQRLEDILGVRLIDRNRRSARLTPAGETLRQQTRDVLERVETLVEVTRSAGGVSRERLRIGYSEMALGSPMPRIIQNFRRLYPGTETVLLEQSSKGSEKALLQNVFDCLFVPDSSEHPKIGRLHMGNDLILACMPETSLLLRNSAIRVEHLRDVPIILPEDGSRFGDRVLAAFANTDIRPNILTRIGRASAILTLVAAEEGVGFIPLSLAGLVPNGVVARPFGEPAVTMPFSLIWRNEPGNVSVDRFVAIARETMRYGGHGQTV